MRTYFRMLLVWVIGMASMLYLLNPRGGYPELLPDGVPWVGNLDELVAALLLFSAIRHFGIDPLKFFPGSDDEEAGTRSRERQTA